MAESSPVRASASPAADMLTPRSKVAKMLADIDDAPTPSPPLRKSPNSDTHNDASRRLPEFRYTESNVGRPSTVHQPTNGPSQTHLGVDSDDDDEDAIRRPQGRAARRMLNQQQESPESDSESQRPQSSPARHGRPSEVESEGEDLYSATPLKARPTTGAMSGSPLDSDSGGLFVSPGKSAATNSEDELPSNPFGSKEKLAQLVAKKREERLRREAEEEQRSERTTSPHPRAEKKRKRRHGPSSAHASSDLPEDVLEDSQEAVNPEIERLMSDAARPTRKASKRALLEMERETQRLARQQALAHQMKVKKKFTTSELFAKFNFRQPQQQNDATAGKVTTASSSAPNSDIVEARVMEPVSTPPSSPPTAGPTPLDKQKAIVEQGALSKLMPAREDSIASLAQMDSDEELPDIEEVMSSARQVRAATMAKPSPAAAPEEQQDRRGLKLARLGKKAVVRQYHDSSDDDDLDIIAPLPKHLQVFDRMANNLTKHTGSDSKAIHALKHLSHIGAYDIKPRKPGKGSSRPSIGPKTLETQLRRKAKDHARLQQQERIAELKAKGIDIQTSEEREREAEVFENLLERAREDAVELRKAEKVAAKEAGVEGQAVEVSDDEDEDYVGSGSEEEDGMGDGEVDEENEGLVDDAAEETDEDEDEEVDEADADIVEQLTAEDELANKHAESTETLDIATPAMSRRKPRQSRVIKDDDDDDSDIELEPADCQGRAAAKDEDPFAAFNFGANVPSESLMSPTQAFQATMQTPTQATQEDSFDILRRIAPPSASSLPPTMPLGDAETQQTQGEESQLSIVPGSQVPESQRIDLGWETQAPETPVPAGLTRGASALSETPGWEPTQDAGLQSPWKLGLRREDTMESITEEHDTQSTVRLRVSESPAPSGIAGKRGRLVRRQAAAPVESDEDDELAPVASMKQQKKDVFHEMARRRTAALTAAERAEAEKEMKHMLEEQAEESDDEYAGIGGDDFVAPETEEDKAMIDSSHVDVDERALAAHFAEKQRMADEAATSKLYKDLTTGALRRKQANAFDLEEDEDEIVMRRRQVRQREEARKRKLLLQDDNIAGLAQGRQSKGKDAFLKAIADDDERDDDLLDLSDRDEDETQPATQDESQPSQQLQQPTDAAGPLREVSGNKRRFVEGEEHAEERPPAKQRRTQASAFKKPASMLEVRESVSFLLDEPETGLAAPPTDLSSDSESDAQDSEHDGDSDMDDLEELENTRNNDGGLASNPTNFDAQAMPPPRLPASQRRTAPKPTVVDRLSLKRGSSTSSEGALGRTAWAAPAGGAFKAPSLLRRATTNVSSATNDRGVSTPTHLGREGSSGVRMGGSKKSSLAYQVRAEERKAIVEAGVKRREENTKRIALMRRSSSMLGKGLTGRFE